MFVRQDPVADTPLRLVLDAAPAPLFSVDRRGRCTYINRAAAELFGYPPHLLVGQFIARLILGVSDWRECPFCPPPGLQEPPAAARFIRGNGSTFAARYTRAALVDGDWARGAVVTLEVLPEAAAPQARLDRFFAQSPLSMVLYALDGRVLSVNDAFKRMWGFDRIDGDYSVLRDPQLIQLGVMPYVERAFTGESTLMPPICYNAAALHPAGQEHWAQAFLYPIKDADGTVREVALIHQDVSDLKRAELLARGQIEALVDTLGALAAEPMLDSFLGQVLTTIATQLGVPLAEFWLTDFEDDLSVMHMTSWHGRILMGADQPDHPGACGKPLSEAHDCEVYQQVYLHRRCLVLENVPNNPVSVPFREWAAARGGIQTMVIVPLVLADRVIGSFSVCSTEKRVFSSQEIELAQALAHQATLAVQLTRLAEQGRRSAVLEERNRMARELHDTLMQGLAGIVVQLQAATDAGVADPLEGRDHIDRARTLARQSLAEARRSVRALRPQLLEQGDLGQALADLLQQSIYDNHTEARCEVRGTPFALPAEAENQLLRIAGEALSNALRHARANRVHVELDYERPQVRLVVADDGRGFDPDRVGTDRFGLVGMRERAERIGADLRLESVPGQGTRVAVTLVS
ncbi:MAG: PAS domain S-box protein [Aphanocapsa lilacina HA4352-LM1]|jgi:PAS domain S-box-containing protein|nr:PAS domain S-box protein [Aphanocapsa lilacina HA4352-LM1]